MFLSSSVFRIAIGSIAILGVAHPQRRPITGQRAQLPNTALKIKLPPQPLRYNQVQQISSHNSYDDNGPKANIETQLAMGVRSFELDLHNSDTRQNWDVYHVTHIFSGGDYIDNLKGGLQKFRAYHNAHPNHEVITIWFELKDDWKNDGHNPADLDASIDAEMGDLVYRPGTLKAAAQPVSNLREAVAKIGWPTLDSLRGKFIFAAMGNDKAGERYLYDVLGYDGGYNDGHEGYHGNRNVFMAPEENLAQKLNPPPGDNWLNAIFFNCHNTDGFQTPLSIVEKGFVARIWRIDSQDEYNYAMKSKAQHMATDHVTQAIFSPRLVDSNGNLFRPIQF